MSEVITYGKRALSARNASIIAARTTPQRALPTLHAPHPRDVRLAKLRASQTMEAERARIIEARQAVPGESHARRCDCVMAYLGAVAASGEALPTNVMIADALGITADQVATAVQSLCNQGLIRRISNRHWRVIEIAETGALLRSIGAPAEAVPV